MKSRLSFIDEGCGETLVLLHGNGESSEHLRAQIDAFKTDFRVIAPDTRGHGRSPRGNAPFTLEQFAIDLDGLFDELNISHAHILGFSDGANIAMLFALEFPERVLSLVLAGANLCPEGLKDNVRAQDKIDLAKALQSGDIRRIEMLRLMTDEPHINPAALTQIAVPTLIIAGTRDMIKEEHTRLIAESIPGAQLRFIEGTHFVVYEDPDTFNQAIEEFYTGLSLLSPRS